MSWGTFIFFQVSFSEKIFINHLGLSWNGEVLDLYISCKWKDCLSILYVKLLSKYIMKHFQQCPGNQLPNEHNWWGGYKYNRRMNWIKGSGKLLTGISSEWRLQVIEINDSNKNWDANYFTPQSQKNWLCVLLTVCFSCLMLVILFGPRDNRTTKGLHIFLLLTHPIESNELMIFYLSLKAMHYCKLEIWKYH